MKLLEVDEAANHIRELVDSDANIIWGSAFNPDLQGKIRVSVVATGIEQSAEQAEIASRPMSFNSSRGPVRPNAAPAATPTVSYSTQAERAPAPAPAPQAPPAAPEPFDLGADAEMPGDDAALELGGAEELIEEPAPASSHPSQGGARPARQPLDLSGPEAQAARSRAQDELDLKAQAETAAAAPAARRRTFAPEAAAAPAPAAPAPRPASTGSTLFERMSNLSRGAKPTAPDDSDDDDGGSISIPRFLGRQNNQ
jgi:cell division protein FtsZ